MYGNPHTPTGPSTRTRRARRPTPDERVSQQREDSSPRRSRVVSRWEGRVSRRVAVMKVMLLMLIMLMRRCVVNQVLRRIATIHIFRHRAFSSDAEAIQTGLSIRFHTIK